MFSSCRFAFLVFALLTATLAGLGQTGLVISQIYGGGGNSAATYSNDFIELYNASAAPVSLGGLSVQYASATGTSWNAATLPAGNLAPGHYYLIEAAAGTTPAQALPTPDLILTLQNVSQSFVINLSGTTGKVALVTNTTPLTTACPTGATILDFVGYGTMANCAEGNAAAPTTSNNMQSIIRRVSSVDSNNNAADFTTVSPPNPRNSTFGSTTGPLSATGLANPPSVTAGQSTTLIVTVTPGTSPASTNITVSGDLRLIGGTQTQAFTNNNDGTLSFVLPVTTTASGAISLPISVTDGQGRTASPTIALTVSQPAPTVAISAIQGEKSKAAATISPYAGKIVTTQGVVTTVLSNGFFIQSLTPDNDPLTPEGIDIFTSSKPPATVVVGAVVTVTGTVQTYPAVTVSHTPATEITSPTIVVSGTAPLPAPVTLTTADLSLSGGLYQLTPYEGMRVSIASMTTVSGTAGYLVNEATETAGTNGYFYAVIGNTPRPFREPGIDIRDNFPNQPPDVAHFDDNPERIVVDSILAGGSSIEISTGAVLPNVTGVLDFTFSNDTYYDPSRLILDATYDRTQVMPGMTVQAVPAPAGSEFTVASFNIERFFNPNSADDLYYVPAGVNGYNRSSSTPIVSTGETFVSEAIDVTAAAYATRLKKVSLAIRNVLNTPDIVTLEEVENQSVANDIAAQVSSDAGVPNLYTAYSTDNSTFYSQDGTGISIGFLVKNSTVDKLGFTQFGQGESFTPTTSTSPLTLNDRPWLVLNAGVKRAGAKDYPVTVIVNHMKALTGENSTTSTSTRQKKELQAEDIAKYIQTLQAAGQHVISGGDFNAFEFSDGYTDTLATYTNVNVLPATQVVQPNVPNLVNPPLVDMALLLPPSQRWSYQEDGSAQILDHMVVTPELVAGGAHLVYAHLDADFPLTAYNDPTTPARTSDHDAAVGYFGIPAPVLSATLSPQTADFGVNGVGVPSSGHAFTLTNTGEAPITVTSVTASGDYAVSSACGSLLDLATSCSINVVLTATGAGTRAGVLTVTTSAGTYTATLTGQGVASVLAPTSTLLVISPTSPIGSGSVVTLTTTVAGVSAPVTAGTVNFYDTLDGLTLIGSAELTDQGTASIRQILGVGRHSLHAQFVATTSFLASSSKDKTLVVSPELSYQTTGLLTFQTAGTSFRLTDTATFYGQAAPKGKVHFLDQATGTDKGASLSPLTASLAPPVTYTTGATSTGALVSTTGDFNKDGIPDLAVTNLADGTVSILLGTKGGSSAFLPQVSYATGQAPYAVVAGDFNNDGSLDLAVSNLGSGTVTILLNNGAGIFGSQHAYNTGTTGTAGATTSPEPYGLAIAEINKDGYLDLVVTNTGEGTVSVLLGNGDGSFAAPLTTAVGSGPFATAVADFNGDGRPDLMVVSSTSGSVAYLLGDGSGSFSPAAVSTYSTGLTPYSAAVGDFNQDGFPDVAITSLGDPKAPPAAGSVTILLNNAGSGFATTTYATGVTPTSVAVLDFDGDGRQDLAVTNSGENTVGILRGVGDGTFGAQVAYPSVSNPYQLAVADFNGDGKQDLAVTTFGSNVVGVQPGTQTGVYQLDGLALKGLTHTIAAIYTPAPRDAYATSVSNTVQVPSGATVVPVPAKHNIR